MSTISVTDARASLTDIVDRVQAGDEVTLTRHGQPVAVLVRPDLLRSRRVDVHAATAPVRDALARARTLRLAVAPTIDPERAEELLAQVEASRGER